MCFSMALSETTRRLAIAPFDRPSAIRESTSRPWQSVVEHLCSTAGADELCDDFRIESGPAGGNSAQSVEELGHVANTVLQ